MRAWRCGGGRGRPSCHWPVVRLVQSEVLGKCTADRGPRQIVMIAPATVTPIAPSNTLPMKTCAMSARPFAANIVTANHQPQRRYRNMPTLASSIPMARNRNPRPTALPLARSLRPKRHDKSANDDHRPADQDWRRRQSAEECKIDYLPDDKQGRYVEANNLAKF